MSPNAVTYVPGLYREGAGGGHASAASAVLSRTDWPAADIIIGNPPFLGAKRLKPERGADYVNAVRNAYPEVPGMADYCVYWFRRANDHLPVATATDPFKGRAGLVGTQNIRNNQSRVGGLDQIVKTGTIVEAVDNQPWSGEANVHVSIANWVKTRESSDYESPAPSPRRKNIPADAADSKSAAAKTRTPKPVDELALLIPSRRKLWFKVDPKSPLVETEDPSHQQTVTKGKRGASRSDKSYELAFREPDEINSALSDQVDAAAAKILQCNAEPQRLFQGNTPGHDGFVLSTTEAKSLLKQDSASSKVVFPYLIGRELVSGDGKPERFIIDFGQINLLQAKAFEGAFDHIESLVLPDIQKKAREEKERGDGDSFRQSHLERWWMHWRGRAERIRAIAPLKARFIACSRVTKRPLFVFVSKSIRPGDALQTFAFDDDFSFAILQSNAHWQWFIVKCSKLKSDFRYTPESVFDTFPWPQSPTKKQINTVASAGREIRSIRDKVLPTMTGGLRALYRTLELPGKNPLKDAHAALDAAVLDAYGFSAKKDLLKQLLDLNLAVARRIEKGEEVTAPGVPKSFGDAKSLITDDCIRP